MKLQLISLSLFCPLGLGCAVATVDDPIEDAAADTNDLSFGEDTTPEPTETTSNAVVVTSDSTTNPSTPPSTEPEPTTDAPTAEPTPTQEPPEVPTTEPEPSPSDPNGCIAIGHQEDSGEFGSTEARCFIVDYSAPMYGWRTSNASGRTVTINGEEVGSGDVSSGAVPWPGSSPYLVEFSAGDTTNTTWAFW